MIGGGREQRETESSRFNLGLPRLPTRPRVGGTPPGRQNSGWQELEPRAKLGAWGESERGGRARGEGSQHQHGSALNTKT